MSAMKYIESITKEKAKELKKRAKKLGRELRCEVQNALG